MGLRTIVQDGDPIFNEKNAALLLILTINWHSCSMICAKR